MQAFRRESEGYVSSVDEMERGILLTIVEDVSALLSQEEQGGHRGIVDPALMRLFPAASLSDPELASEIRGLTFDEISRTKASSLEVVTEQLRRPHGHVTVPEGAVQDWLRALNDVRIVLAERLGISDGADAERFYQMALEATQNPDEEENCGDEQTVALASLYSGISWWQGSLLEALGSER